MKYLFFDIESPDGNVGAICEFGYVICDEHFKVLDQNVFVMNPERKFNTINRKRRPDVHFYYPKHIYLNSPTFPNYYERIKKLLTQPDVMVFGYSVSNDIRYIAYTCKRYLLPSFDYVAFDVQTMHKNVKKLDHIVGLDTAINDIPVNEKQGLFMHRSDCDAKMTMLVLKYLLANHHLTLNELLNNGSLYRLSALTYIKQLEENRKNKQERAKIQKLWFDFVNNSVIDERKTCTLSSQILKSDVKTLADIIKNIKQTNLRPVRGARNAQYLIVKDKNDELRLRAVFTIPITFEFITLEELVNFKKKN